MTDAPATAELKQLKLQTKRFQQALDTLLACQAEHGVSRCSHVSKLRHEAAELLPMVHQLRARTEGG